MKDAPFRIGLVQMCSGTSEKHNIDQAEELVSRACDEGADLVITPEMSNVIESDRKRLIANACSQEESPSVAAFARLARDRRIFLQAGSLALRGTDGRLVNRSLVFSPAGEIIAAYDKIHMFDVDLGNGEAYRESAHYRPGSKAVVAQLPWGGLGMTICYDVRFAGLYRVLAQNGADFLAVPSAFTRPTGRAHWEVLLRARAIETGCFVFAPAQTGEHESGRRTWGHSLVVSPWGDIIAGAGKKPGILVADIDPQKVRQARARIGALAHDREFEL